MPTVDPLPTGRIRPVPMLAELVDAVVGVDTHRDTHEVEIALPTGTAIGTRKISNDNSGFAELLAWIVDHAPGPRVVVSIEGTRGYEIEWGPNTPQETQAFLQEARCRWREADRVDLLQVVRLVAFSRAGRGGTVMQPRPLVGYSPLVNKLGLHKISATGDPENRASVA